MIREPMDDGDVAADYQGRLNAAGQAAIREKMDRQAASPSLTICLDCKGPIPPKRRRKQKGCTRCVDCQSLYERLTGGM